MLRTVLLAAAAAALFVRPAAAQVGHVLDAVGPINQSMGGAGVGLPLDAMGALHWNPASIAGLKQSEFGFGALVFAPQTELSSTVRANSFGPGFPPADWSGSTASDTDISPIPSIGLVSRDPDSRWSFGLGGFAIAGFGVDFPGSGGNPIVSPQRPDGGAGFGPIYSEFQMMQFSPTAAVRLAPGGFENGWAVGVAPTVNWASLAVSPFAAAPPDATGRYLNGSAADAVWGLGFKVGAYFERPDTPWSFGVSYKSPQWFQDFSINTADSLGNPRTLSMDLDYPAIFNVGLGYRGWRRARLAWDVRYIDYEGADGFQAAGFTPDGAVTGFGWQSVWATAVGVEFDVTSRLKWRVGYAFNEVPIDSQTIFFNTPAPALIKHHLSTGFTHQTKNGWLCSLAFKYGFANDVSGPWQAPGFGAVPGTEVEAELATYGLGFGVSRRY